MRKIYLVFVVLFLLMPFAEAQKLNFKNLADMELARGAITSAADSNFIYVSNGFSLSNRYTTEIERYDIKKNTWAVFAKSSVAKRFASSIVVGNNLYLFNGEMANGKINDKMEVINLSTGAVSFTTVNPFPTKSSGVALWNGLIYVFGGSYLNAAGAILYSNNLYSFNPVSNVWTKLSNMPGEGRETKGEIINGQLYVIGGYNGALSDTIYKYDINSDTWSTAAIMPDNISAHATTTYGSKIYIVGDYKNLMHMACYDISTNTYSNLKKRHMIGRRHAGAHIINGKLYIMGGNQSQLLDSALSSLQRAAVK